MKKNLSTRILFLFTVILTVQTVFISGFIFFSIRGLFTRNIAASDLESAREMAGFISDLKQGPGDWSFFAPGQGMESMRNMGMGRPFGGLRRQGMPMLVMDINSRVVFSNVPMTGLNLEQLRNQAEKIYFNGRVDGYLLLGSMAQPGLGAQEREFLTGIVQVLSISAFTGILIWLIAGGALLKAALSPLKKLMTAMDGVKAGIYQHDISVERQDEIGRLTVRFNEMTKALLADREYKKRLIADTAHELRTPLSVIQTSLEMMLDGIYDITPKRLKLLQEEVLRFSALVQGMHDLSVLDANDKTLQLQQLDVVPVVKKSLGLFAYQAEASSVIVETDIQDDPVMIEGNEEAILQISANFLSNAFRILDDREDARIRVRLKRAGDFIEWNVEDNGPGIPPEYREKVFERFFRVDAARSRKDGGSGLGLSIVKHLVDSMQGEVSCRVSELGGCCFTVKLPAMP